jgi:hypothetical protein
LFGLDPDAIIAAFEPYRLENTSATQMVNNLEAKLQNRAFLEDINSLVVRNDSKMKIQRKCLKVERLAM